MFVTQNLKTWTTTGWKDQKEKKTNNHKLKSLTDSHETVRLFL